MYLALGFSPWPLFGSIAASAFPAALLVGIKTGNWVLGLILAVLAVTGVSLGWFKDLIKEWAVGSSTSYERAIFRKGFGLFIVREIILFFSFFWTFFHRRLAPTPELGRIWPPIGINAIEIGVPLLNTGLLLLRGVRLTWSHHCLYQGLIKEARASLFLTVLLGSIFLAVQIFEYTSASFTFADRVFGRIFFLATGFHGAHVIAGARILLTIFFITKNPMPQGGYSIFDFRAWYWHFVDVVWLFLFVCVYWWGRC